MRRSRVDLEFVLDLIYPRVCGICGRIDRNSLCKVCSREVEKIAVCKVDSYKNRYYSKHIYIFNYAGLIRKKIIDYKFNDKSYLSEFFVKSILKNKNICKIIGTYDIIIPVPIHRKRNNERGYNQSELIAKELAKELRIKMICNGLYKSRSTIEQSKLNKSRESTEC